MEKRFDTLMKNKEELCKKNFEISKNNDYTTVNLSHYDYFSNYYKLIAIDFSRIFRTEAINSIMHVYFCIGFIDIESIKHFKFSGHRRNCNI